MLPRLVVATLAVVGAVAPAAGAAEGQFDLQFEATTSTPAFVKADAFLDCTVDPQGCAGVPIQLELIRNGVVVGSAGPAHEARIDMLPEVGDVAKVYTGDTERAAVPFEAMPAADDLTCAVVGGNRLAGSFRRGDPGTSFGAPDGNYDALFPDALIDVTVREEQAGFLNPDTTTASGDRWSSTLERAITNGSRVTLGGEHSRATPAGTAHVITRREFTLCPQTAPPPDEPTPQGTFGTARGGYDPPAWLLDGFKVLRARGAACATRDSDAPYGVGQRQQIFGDDCTRAIAEAEAKLVGGAFQFGDSCSGFVRKLDGEQVQDSYVCRLVANPGTEASPNLATWACSRHVSSERGTADVREKIWSAWRNAVWPRTQRFKKLSGCLAPRALVSSAAGGIHVVCSHACRVTARLAGDRVRRKLRPGKRGQLALPAVAGRLRLTVTAAGTTRRRVLAARARSGRLRFRPAIVG